MDDVRVRREQGSEAAAARGDDFLWRRIEGARNQELACLEVVLEWNDARSR